MKNRIRKPIIIILAFTLTALIAFATGCTGYSSIRVENPQTNTNFVVRGNGSIAVQYGPYVYFINGTRGSFDDPDANLNRWGNVVQGGLYRARLNGIEYANQDGYENWAYDFRVTSVRSELEENYGIYEHPLFDFRLISHDTNDPRTFRFNRDPSNFSFGNSEYDEEFLDREELHERVDFIENTLIAPKAIGTASGGGIFIFGDFIYFASPNNNRNRQGRVQYNYTDFFRMRLNGGGVQHIFRTRGDTAGLPFAFYSVGNRVYLVAAYHNDDELITIVSVGMNMHGRNISRAYYITQLATTVHMPFRTEFDRNDNSVRLEDFIFYTRDIDTNIDINMVRTGNLIVVSSPCGNESFSYQATGEHTSIEAISDNTIFYTRSVLGRQEVLFSNLHDVLMDYHTERDRNGEVVRTSPISPRYRAYQAGLAQADKAGQISGIVAEDVAQFATRVFFRGHNNNHAGYMLGFTGDGVQLISHIDPQFGIEQNVRFLTGNVEYLFIRDGYLFYLEGSQVFRIKLFADNAVPQLLASNFITAGGALHTAVVANHFMFFTARDARTPFDTGYAHFVNMTRIGAEPFFIGTLHEDHIITDEDLLAYLRAADGGYVEDDE